jgi:hypothetical protein
MLPVTLRTAIFNIKKFHMVLALRLNVLYGSQNKQRLGGGVFTTRYALSPYIKQATFLFKELKINKITGLLNLRYSRM